MCMVRSVSLQRGSLRCARVGLGQDPEEESGEKPPEAESPLTFGCPTKAIKFPELTVSGKMYLLYLTALHLFENESGTKTANIFPQNCTAKTKVRLLHMFVIGANECLGHCGEVHGIAARCL